MIEIQDAKLFFEIQSKFERIPFTQSEAWYNYSQAKGESIVFFVDDENDTQIAFWGRKKKLPFFSKHILLVDTPLLKPNLTERTIRKRFLSMIEYNYIGFEIDSISEYDVEYEVGLRRAGFLRPLGFSKCPLSIEMDLTQQFNYDSNWKRNVKQAKSLNITINEVKNPTSHDAQIFCDIFNETKRNKELSYSFKNKEIFSLINSHSISLFIAQDRNNKIVSSQIFYSTNKYCYSILRANSTSSRNNNASYLLYNDIFETLSKSNYKTYDFGRIPPSNHSTDSVYVFKNASRGRKIQYNGEWVFYKKKWVEYLMFVYKQFVLRKQRY
ncbi:hypothetical protein D1614_13560 [Maribellus luteus]|uniref:Peptidoglycan bridge formation glycyltransferase FemA/FemB family protein n=1 Tax=Maribellus luteus TaxID=2305463 RepID=A0A399T053_9BACT|nr:peptidoglycan bridge formation glycyltransferase FemA/FemB family protein [Maribellus luteus]RIJ47607.1 hypothetical protein D1614_13560 [Maribellus luteus]